MQPDKKETHPHTQWDNIAYQLVMKAIAPKGFKELTSGSWKGTSIAKTNAPGLTKEAAFRAAEAASGLIRAYRGNLRRALIARQVRAEDLQKAAEIKWQACRFWEFSMKRNAQYEYTHYRDQVGLLEIIINEVDKMGTKWPTE